jgi:aromatic-L-amino-acid decarboxylase
VTPEEFRAAGHELIDWIADYRARIPQLPVQATVTPGDVRGAIPSEPPAGQEPIEALLRDLDGIVVPAVTQIHHPMHFGWFPANASPSSVLGDLASSGLAALGISWQSAPALTEVEEVVCDWLRQLTGLDGAWRGAIHDTASTACLVALLIARERASAEGLEAGGLQAEPQPLVVYSTAAAHSSVAKATLLAGFGRDNLRLVDADPWTHALIPAALRATIEADLRAGRRPAAAVLNFGSTGTTAFDPIAEVVPIAREFGLWVHVDGAMAGSGLLLPELRELANGLDGADSFAWNPHKWMGTVVDCALLYVRDPDELTRVLSTSPSYLRSAADGVVTELRDWGIPLGRRFRALKLWFQLRLDGVEAIQQRLRRDLANAAWLAEQVRAAPDWQVVAPVPLQTVCLRHIARDRAGEELRDEALDRHTLRWADAVNASGAAFVTPARLDDGWMVRVSIGVEATEREHVAALWDLLQHCATAPVP